MLYVCPRCNYETSVAKYMRAHCNRKSRCENINSFLECDDLELYDNIVLKAITDSRKIIKKGDSKYECPVCFRMFTCHSSAYRHLMTCKVKPFNEIDHTKSINYGPNFIKSVNNIIETQNNYFFINQVVNPFENEDLSHIDKTLILEIIVHDNSNIFSRIHTELIKNPTNYNIFIESSKSRKVSVFTDTNKIEKKNTIDALSLRIKSIYDKTKVIIKNIYEKCPCVLSEIYDTDSAKFNCFRTDTLKIFNTLNEIIDYRYIQYNKKPESSDDTINQNRANLKLVMDLIEIRGATKNFFLCIQ